MRSKTVLSLTLALVAGAAWAANPALRQTNPRLDERALKSGPTGHRTESPTNTVNYSGTVVGGPSWDRPFADCTGQSALGPVTYHVQPFFVSAAGAYDATSTQTGWDGYIFIYQNAFDPNNPNTNCVVGNDDGSGGIGTSEILGQALSSGVQYILVTTAFEAGEEGPFDNSITGPGTITLGGLNGNSDLSITKTAPSGFVGTGSFTFDLTVANAGPDPATSVVVSDNLPASLTYDSDTCGGTGAPAWTWNIGNLANGASASCTITVHFTSGSCSAANNTATVASAQADSNSANNSSTAGNATEAVADGSFEVGSPSVAWTEASTNFGTPLCTIADCGTGTGTGPRTGDWWAWFGGVAAAETGSMTQTITIAAGANTLDFYTEFPVCANTTDFVRATIDGTPVWTATGADASCNTVGYVHRTADISAFADGGGHTLVFESTISGSPSGTNFFVDDISIAVATCTAAANADLAISKTAPGGVVPIGSNVTYTLAVTNNGPGAASGVTVTDTLPAGLTYVSNDCGAAFAAPTLTWNIGALAFPGAATCHLTATVTGAGPFINTASVTSSGDGNAANNASTFTVVGGSSVVDVPTLGSLGILALFAGLAGAGLLLLRRSAA